MAVSGELNPKKVELFNFTLLIPGRGPSWMYVLRLKYPVDKNELKRWESRQAFESTWKKLVNTEIMNLSYAFMFLYLSICFFYLYSICEVFSQHT